MQLPHWFQHWIKQYRHRLGDETALLQLSALGILVGLVTGVLIQAFRFLIELPGDQIYGSHEWFERLSAEHRLLLVVGGALSLGLVFQFILKSVPSLGLSHVVQRLNLNHGRFEARPALIQFVVGIWMILTGQSSGREGPAIHLGAAASALIGQYWRLPNNSIRILSGCGTAAAIAASFNTPIAGVLFAMEVVLLEYTIGSFIPIMLAAAAGTIITRMVYGDVSAFTIYPLDVHSHVEVAAYIGIGIGIGMVSALFCFIHRQGLKMHHLPIWARFSLAGLFTGLLAIYVPEIMGISYDTLDSALAHQISIYALLIIAIAKLFATAVSSGMGLPIGIVGPTLVIGGCFGGASGILINFLAPNFITNDAFYVMLGMGAMMGAVLNAPLAALIALLELTNTPDIILPGMIAIVVSSLMVSQVFKQIPPHIASLERLGQHRPLSMFEVALQRVGVSSLMNSNMKSTARQLTFDELDELLLNKPRWVMVSEANSASILLHGMQLEQWYSEAKTNQGLFTEQKVDLLATPGEHLNVSELSYDASGLEAWQEMQKDDVDAVLITGLFDAYAPAISGIITKPDIENYYHRPRRY
ncbi:MAG: chloride channel protein [Pseudomonadales bacterium]|nr:chloride channel protein [Pseudomonadales bacterium]